MLDQLRHDLQHRLDDLLAEADKLRRALVALGSGERKRPSTADHGSRASRSRRRTPTGPPRGRATARRTPSTASAQRAKSAAAAGNGTTPPDGVGRDQERRPRRVGDRERDDSQRGRQRHRTRPREREHHTVQARQNRRDHQGNPRLPARRSEHDRSLIAPRLSRPRTDASGTSATDARCNTTPKDRETCARTTERAFWSASRLDGIVALTAASEGS